MAGAGQAAPGGDLLAEWRTNLGILAANRTKGYERVVLSLGDRLWTERGQVRCVPLLATDRHDGREILAGELFASSEMP